MDIESLLDKTQMLDSELIGMHKWEALEKCRQEHINVRIVSEDDRYVLMTYDYNFNRLNLIIEHNRVRAVERG